MKKVLYASSEVHPLIKTGGLADVSGSLPKALRKLEQDVRIIIPNYSAILTELERRYLCTLRINNYDVNILETQLPDSDVKVWMVDHQDYFGLPGNPYQDQQGYPWPNNAERFALFCRIAVEIAMNRAHLDWHADIVHCNDWQTGLIPALLSLEQHRPATIFTIHNMAYQGLFPATEFRALDLPEPLWCPTGLEFYGMLSFIKGGLAYADRVTTVSPTYALEIQTPDFGCGLEGLLSHRNGDLTGIINGIDLEYWNPESDQFLAQNYNSSSMWDKRQNKTSLQQQLELPVNENIPVFGLISRLVEQKGIDMILDCLPDIITMPVQFVLLGNGDKNFEQRLLNFSRLYPEKIAITIGYNEQLAHLIEAGADVFLMPSRFEPCGLNQMYSQRYGTIPIVRRTGGLADTVVDSLPQSLSDNTASGIVFNTANSGSLLEAIKRTLILYNDTKSWEKMQHNAMAKDFSWENSAKQYLQLYKNI